MMHNPKVSGEEKSESQKVLDCCCHELYNSIAIRYKQGRFRYRVSKYELL